MRSTTDQRGICLSMRRILQALIDVLSGLQKASEKVNRAAMVLCGILAFLLMLFICVNITGRYLFRTPVPGTLEVGESVIVFIIFLTLAYVQVRQGHFRVELLVSGVSETARPWFNAFALATGFVFTFFLATKALGFALRSWEIREINVVVPLPIYPAKFAFFLGCALLCIEFALQFTRLVVEMLVRALGGKGISR